MIFSSGHKGCQSASFSPEYSKGHRFPLGLNLTHLMYSFYSEVTIYPGDTVRRIIQVFIELPQFLVPLITSPLLLDLGSTFNLTGHTLSCLCIRILVEVWNGAVGLMEQGSARGPRTSTATV